MKKLIAILLFSPLMAHAAFKTGNELYSDMTATDAFSRGLALGYVMAVADAARSVWFCPPADGGGITAGQIFDMTKNYLAANPQVRNYPADVLMITLLRQNWPCATSKGGTRL